MRILGLLPILLLLPVLVGAGFVLVLAGGPKVFLPPNEYNLKMTVNATVDGRNMSHVGGVRCSVRDQRGSIAATPWSIDQEFGLPFFLRRGGGAVILTGINPCHWRETTPQPGIVYDMNLLGDVYDELGADWGDLAFWGTIRILDNISRPRTLRSVPLAHADDRTIWGVRINSFTLEVADEPVDSRLLQSVPALRERLSFTTIQAAVDIYQDVTDCTPRTGDVWITMPHGSACRPSRGRFLPFTVSPDYRRITIGSLTSPMKDPDFSISTDVLVAAGRGGNVEGRSVVWLPRVCIEGKCFDTPTGDPAGKWIAVLLNPGRNLVVTLSYASISTNQWLENQ